MYENFFVWCLLKKIIKINKSNVLARKGSGEKSFVKSQSGLAFIYIKQ